MHVHAHYSVGFRLLGFRRGRCPWCGQEAELEIHPIEVQLFGGIPSVAGQALICASCGGTSRSLSWFAKGLFSFLLLGAIAVCAAGLVGAAYALLGMVCAFLDSDPALWGAVLAGVGVSGFGIWLLGRAMIRLWRTRLTRLSPDCNTSL